MVLDASTLAFVDDRGVVTLPCSTWNVLCFSVVRQAATQGPAVLAAWGYSAFPSQNGHRLSRDGGRTWEDLFSGVQGLPLYLGNQLHPVSLATAL